MKNFIQNDYDKITRELLSVLDKKVGRAYTQEDINNIEKEGKERYLKKIPPGYGDLQGKEGKYKTYRDVRYQSVYGDLILWNQIIEKAKEENIKNVIIITNDSKKDDWFYHTISKNNPIGPRIELISELKLKADAELFMYTSYQLIEQFNKFEGEMITLDEFENTAKDVDVNFEDDLKSIRRIRSTAGQLTREWRNDKYSISNVEKNNIIIKLIDLLEEVEQMITYYQNDEYNKELIDEDNAELIVIKLYSVRKFIVGLIEKLEKKDY